MSLENNTFYVLWHEKKQKYWGRSGVGMRWTDVPKLYAKVSHALNAYTVAVANDVSQGWRTPEGQHKPDPENVKLIPVHLTSIGTDQPIRPLSDFYEVVKDPKSRYRPYSIKRKKK